MQVQAKEQQHRPNSIHPHCCSPGFWSQGTPRASRINDQYGPLANNAHRDFPHFKRCSRGMSSVAPRDSPVISYHALWQIEPIEIRPPVE